jgi:hypothetical protein
MAFSLGTMTAYIEENKAELITKAILGSKTMGLVDVRTGIKSSERIPVLESTTPWQSSVSCGFSTSGTTTINQITLSTTPIQVMEQVCLNDLEAYFTQKWLPAGANNDSTSLAAAIVDRKMAQIANQVERAIWQGRTTYTNDSVLKALNGFISTIDTAGTAVAATQQASISTSTVRGIFEDIYTKIPAAAAWNEEVVAFCGMDVFKTLLVKLTTDNLYHYTTDSAANRWEIVYPGTNMKIVALPGLNNDNPVDTGSLPTAVKNRIFATYKSNLLVGTDLTSDMDNLKVWYSEDDDVLKFRTRFRLGVQVKFADHIVQYTNS